MLHLHGITKRFGAKILFENAEAHLNHRTKTALVGPNGAGKTTLIRMVMGQDTADEGKVTRASHLVIGYLAQEVPKFSGRTVLEEVTRLDGRMEELRQARTELETSFQTQTPEASDLERYGRILEEIEHLDESRLESRAKEILGGLGFKETDYTRPLTEFSGGWLMRVALSRVLLMDPDLLILDEPTNHLDLESLLWLEEFLKDFQGALLLVSHDTAFLNRIVYEVLEIDQRKILSYKGNLDAWILQKEERLAVLRSQYQGQQARIAEIEDFVARFGAKATKARQAQSRLKELDRMERIELPDEKAKVRFRFPPAPHSGKEVVTLKKASMRYGEKTIFRDLSWVIQRGSRVSIVGVNGAGKSTLLKLIGGILEPSDGEIRLGHQVKVGYYAQLQAESLKLDHTILQELEACAPETPLAQIRGIAGAFLFSGTDVEKTCRVLSGGEKARVALAKLLLSPSNFLILDEPTNHLDVQSRGVLLEALQNYTGTLCLVSHDRSFVSPLVDSVLEIIPSPQGSQVIPLVGTYDDYLERKLKETIAARAGARPGKPRSTAEEAKPQTRSGPSNNQKQAWKKEITKLESDIGRLEKRQSELHQILGDEKIYQDKAEALKYMEEQREVQKNLHASLSRWEEVSLLLGSDP